MKEFNYTKAMWAFVLTALTISAFTGCNKDNSNKEELNTSEIIDSSEIESEKTSKLSGVYKAFSIVDVEFLGASPHIAIKLSKVPDSIFSKDIEYIRLKDKNTQGYKLNDIVDIIIKFKNDVDISELSLEGCSIDSSKNTCVYSLEVNGINGEYITGGEFINANNKLDSVCNEYANDISKKVTGSTWGNNKKIQRVKNYSLIKSYSVENSNINVDDSVNLGREASRLRKAVNGIIREYSYDLVYEDGTESTVCTMLILPNICKMSNGEYKLVDPESIYNIGTFKIDGEQEILSKFSTLTILDLAKVTQNQVDTNTSVPDASEMPEVQEVPEVQEQDKTSTEETDS